ncbi:MAG: hypothetical protein U0136_19420 [Bdellovibrionota bacterium]
MKTLSPMQLFRVVLPSWRFFDQPCDIPRLRYRVSMQNGSLGEWREALQPPPRRWWNLFFNPKGTAYLACHSLLRQLETEIGELDPADTDAFPESAVFRLVHNLARYCIARDEALRTGAQYQFSVLRVSVDGQNREEQFLLSKVYEV